MFKLDCNVLVIEESKDLNFVIVDQNMRLLQSPWKEVKRGKPRKIRTSISNIIYMRRK